VASAAPSASAVPADEAEEKTPDKPPGVASVLPGTAARAAHRGLFARSATLAYAAAVEGEDKGAPIAHLWRFDGSAWAEDKLPETKQPVRAIAGNEDGTVWLLTEHEIWKRPPAGAWESVPPPTRAFPEPDPSWEMLDLWVVGADDLWIAARHTSKVAKREVILRLKAPKEIVRWL